MHLTQCSRAGCALGVQMVETGASKAVLPVWRQLQLGVLAGVCVSLGAFLALSISGNNPALSASHPGLYRLLFGAFGRAPGARTVPSCRRSGDVLWCKSEVMNEQLHAVHRASPAEARAAAGQVPDGAVDRGAQRRRGAPAHSPLLPLSLAATSTSYGFRTDSRALEVPPTLEICLTLRHGQTLTVPCPLLGLV